MQSVAHDDSKVLSSYDIIVGATIFFSINGRQDGTKAITTIAYQLAVKLDSYRLFVRREITHNPALLRKSLSRQFTKFIVEPFIHQRILNCLSRLLIIVGGLDECADIAVQQKLLGLIANFYIKYPTSPVVWVIASCPEPHITSFFAQPKVALSYEMDEIPVGSDEACEDVKRYLHDKFRKIQMASISLRELSQWPPRGDLLKIVNASDGLFAYASTVVRYIHDPDYGDQDSLLNDVLEIIVKGTKEKIWGRNHPMAQLDALYSHITSKIPANVMANTRKLLLDFQADYSPLDFHLSCNLLGMTQNAAYGATHHSRSIAIVPGPAEAARDPLQFFHKSLHDYLRDFERSGFSPDTWLECDQLLWRCALRILQEARNGVYIDDTTPFCSSLEGAVLKSGLGMGEHISVSWPANDGDSRGLRLAMFDVAIGQAMEGVKRGDEAFQSLLCIHALTTCFAKLPQDFPFDVVREFAFDESRRHELLKHGILKEVPLEAVDYDEITIHRPVWLRFRSPTAERSTTWNIACQHTRKGTWEHPNRQDCSTHFRHTERYNPKYKCSHCFERFTRHFKMRRSDQLVTVLGLTPTSRLVELRFVDQDDGISDWIYHFFIGDDDEYYYYEEKSEED